MLFVIKTLLICYINPEHPRSHWVAPYHHRRSSTPQQPNRPSSSFNFQLQILPALAESVQHLVALDQLKTVTRCAERIAITAVSGPTGMRFPFFARPRITQHWGQLLFANVIRRKDSPRIPPSILINRRKESDREKERDRQATGA